MNKSLAPLIIGLAVVILLTMILISVQTPYMERRNYTENNGNGGDNKTPTMQLSPYDTQTGQNGRTAPTLPKTHISKNEINNMYLEALNLYNTAKFKQSEDKIRTVLVFDPKNGKALMLFGRLLYLGEKFNEAEGVYRRLAKLHPDSPMVYNNLGQVLAKQYRFSEAIDVLSTAKKKDPKSPIINLNLAGAHAVIGERKKAISFFKEAYSSAGKQVLPAALDPTLKSLRDDPEFKEFMKKAEAKEKKDKQGKSALKLSPATENKPIR